MQNCVQNSSEFSGLEAPFRSPVTVRGSQDSQGQAGAGGGRSLEPVMDASLTYKHWGNNLNGRI